jgi:FixJ family two-component response regulator
VSTDLRPILLVTDDSNDVFTFWAYHKQCGIQNPVEVLQDGEDVLKYLAARPKSLPPALLVLSLKLPRTGGIQVLEYLKATRQNDFPSALIIDAEDHDVPLAAIAYRFGAEQFLTRPIQRKQFSDLMSKFQALTSTGHCDQPPPSAAG